MGWTLVAGADLEEGKGKDRMVKGAVLYKIATDDDLDKDKYTFTLSDPKEAVGAVSLSGLMWTTLLI
jgi:hypothetical protein